MLLHPRSRSFRFQVISGFVVFVITLMAIFIYGIQPMLLDQTHAEDVVKILGGNELASRLRSATQAEAFRIKSISRELDVNKPGMFETTSPAHRVGDSDVSELKRLLTLGSSYEWDLPKACLPNYGVLLRLKSGTESIDVYLCFECQMLGITTPGAAEFVGGEGFDPINSRLVSIMKRIFPDDPVIQGL